jgi:hypothetical protein
MRQRLKRHAVRWLLVVAVAAALVVVGLELTEREVTNDAAAGESVPAHVEQIEGSELSHVILEPEAAERIGLATAAVKRAAGGKLAVPYSAVLYDEDGDTWVYTREESLTFVRARVQVEAIESQRALLRDGPAPGTEVVEVGAAELYGSEFEVGH